MEQNDIQNEHDIKIMVDSFYDKVNQDDLLSPVFNDFAKIDWDKHLPNMYLFWSSLLLGTGTYFGSPFGKHVPLPISMEHFDRWIILFNKNIDDHFKGEIAEQAKLKALNISHVFQAKLNHLKSTEL